MASRRMKKKPNILDVLIWITWIFLIVILARVIYTLYYIGKMAI